MPGSGTSAAEVTHVARHGFWLLLGDEELPVPFELFPWFRQATVAQLMDVEWPTADHLYWPQLDVDLSVSSIRNPAAYPLVSRVGETVDHGAVSVNAAFEDVRGRLELRGDPDEPTAAEWEQT